MATDSNEIIDHLKELNLFEGVSREDLSRIARIAKFTTFEENEFVCRQGELDQDLFAIISGSVSIRKGTRLLATLGPGEVVGELAFLDDQPRSADVEAASPLRLIQLPSAEFQFLVERHGTLSRQLLRVLAERVRRTSSHQERVDQLVRAYRERGHVVSSLDPLGFAKVRPHPELSPTYYGLEENDLKLSYSVVLGKELQTARLKNIIEDLQQIYCGQIGWQYMHIDELEIQNWLRERIEDSSYWPQFSRDKQLRILAKLTDAETFEAFLQRKFGGTKRFSLEGGETLISLLDQAIERAGAHGVEEIVIGMAHRGRLNVLANILGKEPSQIFREFEDAQVNREYGSGDVKYHLGFSGEKLTQSGHPVVLTLCFNPSHLEFIGPVVLGRARAKQDRIADQAGKQIMPIVIHGDAAFSGQGVVQELFNLSELAGYSTGGAIHIILNNQIGFTASPEQYRSTQYATDVARMLQVPVFHVNGEHPEAVDKVITLAMEFRARFHKDVVVDMYCYRRHGHNEQDDPTFTQPLRYTAISQRQPLRESFATNLLNLGEISRQDVDDIATQSLDSLERHMALARRTNLETSFAEPKSSYWRHYHGGQFNLADAVPTGVPLNRINEVISSITRIPEGFQPHKRIRRQLEARRAMASGERLFDWAAAEALAFATLLQEGIPVRLSGQDSERGTFGHRHAILRDIHTGARYCPLENVGPNQGRFTVVNSPVSELGVLGFEYGYSLDSPEGLVIWEAQFGDFCNVAQVIVDQFISASEDKWQQLTGLCLFLPHGFEGAGPEHSSARLERFLQLAANDNMRVVNLSTAAQLFHCLRQQALQHIRKPLIAMTPKGLLQHPAAGVPAEKLKDGRFQAAIGEEELEDLANIAHFIFCSGKLYYELAKERNKRRRKDVALIRIEQLYPFPKSELDDRLSGIPLSAHITWVQEEPKNMGAWPYLNSHLQELLAATGRREPFRITRPESASPAVGSKAVHDLQQANLLEQAFEK